MDACVALQVYKAHLKAANKFVAIKSINCMEKVWWSTIQHLVSTWNVNCDPIPELQYFILTMH